jgi:hypothetical protein
MHPGLFTGDQKLQRISFCELSSQDQMMKVSLSKTRREFAITSLKPNGSPTPEEPCFISPQGSTTGGIVNESYATAAVGPPKALRNTNCPVGHEQL